MEEKKKGISDKTIYIIIIIIVAFFAFLFFFNNNANNKTTSNVYESNSTSSSIPTTSTVNTSTKNLYSVGETYTDLSKKITFLSLDDNFTGYNKYSKVKSGNKVIKAEFEFENLSADSFWASKYDFNCYADGYDCESFYGVNDDNLSSTLSEGKKAKGNVYFEVPINAQEITIEYKENVWTDNIVKFKVK